METTSEPSRAATKFFVVVISFLIFAAQAPAEWKEKVLYSFQGLPNDGAYPAGGVVFDKAGNLYGATGWGGGSVMQCPGIAQCGIVYELSPPTEKGKPWTETVLYVFKGVKYNDGNTPQGGVIFDQAGNLYGTTAYGGSGPCQLFGGRSGCGTVFELIPPKQKGGKWTEKVLHNFQGGKDGYFPWGNLTWDSAGNLYGATQYGGGYGSCNAPYYQYCGTVFKLSPPTVKGGKWTEKVLYAFKSINSGQQTGDGASPNGGLLLARGGPIYGTTPYGGYHCPHDNNQGCGTAFVLTPPKTQRLPWTETVLHRFKGSPDGSVPFGGLIAKTADDIYGTTSLGGQAFLPSGTLFRLRSTNSGRTWNQSTLYNFSGGGFGGNTPLAGLVVDAKGSLYGTASVGGNGDGTVFRLALAAGGQMSWTYAVLYSFGKYPDGNAPQGNLIFDKAGNLYGTTSYGGTGNKCQYYCGAVFELQP